MSQCLSLWPMCPFEQKPIPGAFGVMILFVSGAPDVINTRNWGGGGSHVGSIRGHLWEHQP